MASFLAPARNCDRVRIIIFINHFIFAIISDIIFRMEENNLQFIKYLESFDEDFSMSDYTPDEIYEIIHKNDTQKFKDKYFSKYDDVKSSSLKKQDW